MKTLTTILTAVALMGITSSSASAARDSVPCGSAVKGQDLIVSSKISCSFGRAVQRNAHAHPYRDPEVSFKVYSSTTHRSYKIRMIYADDYYTSFAIIGQPNTRITIGS